MIDQGRPHTSARTMLSLLFVVLAIGGNMRSAHAQETSLVAYDSGAGNVQHEVLIPAVQTVGSSDYVKVTAVLQGCQKEGMTHEFFCALVDNGWKYLVFAGGETRSDVIEKLAAIKPGRRVQVSGHSQVVFDTTRELILDDAELLPVNQYDHMLERLQGTWQSNEMPRDQFTILGAERHNSYNGAQTSVEYLSVMDRCETQMGEGLHLFAWDSKGGTRICYYIIHISDTELVLRYFPSGAELTFTRIAG